MGEMLSVKNINVYYGSIHAIKDVSFHVNEGEIVTLIGATGAGKTTTMHAISGLLKLPSGEIDYCRWARTHAATARRPSRMTSTWSLTCCRV